MDAVLDTIAIAARPGATDDERRRGAYACRALAESLDAPGLAPFGDALDANDARAAAPRLAPVTSGTNPFTGLTADQILDLAIARLRGAVGDAGPSATSVGQPLRLPLVPIPRLR